MAWLGVEPVTDDLQEKHFTITPLSFLHQVNASTNLCIITSYWDKITISTPAFVNSNII